MNITVEITVTVERADGSHTRITQERTRHAGDNPRMERDEIGASIVPVVDAAIACFPKLTDLDSPTGPDERCHSWNRGVRCQDDNGHTGNHHNANTGDDW